MFSPILNTIALITGLFCLGIAGAMLLPALVDLMDGHPDWQAFFASSVVIGSLSLLVVLTTQGRPTLFSRRLGFLLVNSLWVSTSLAASVPFMLSSLQLSFADALFESVSGLTTTGGTVLVGLDQMPRGILLWRSMTQGIGGIGILGMGLLLLPVLRIGGMQLFRMESSAPAEKPVARFAVFATTLVSIYLVLILLCALCFALAGMDMFDAINHALTAVATGGFSTHDTSFAGYSTPILLIGSGFMIAGAMPFVALLRAVVNRDLRQAYDPQIPVLLVLIAGFTLLVALAAISILPDSAARIFVHALFNVVSVITTSGFASVDYTQWGPLVQGLILLATFIGGAAGSTSGGFKIYRLIILAETVRIQLKELLYPDGVFVVRYEGRRVTDQTMRAVTVFTAAFFGILLLLTLGLTATGLDLVTAFTGALASLCNVGPGLGPIIGPVGNFSTLPDSAKWLLSLGMYLGRLEILTVLVVLSPTFWRR